MNFMNQLSLMKILPLKYLPKVFIKMANYYYFKHVKEDNGGVVLPCPSGPLGNTTDGRDILGTIYAKATWLKLYHCHELMQ